MIEKRLDRIKARLNAIKKWYHPAHEQPKDLPLVSHIDARLADELADLVVCIEENARQIESNFYYIGMLQKDIGSIITRMEEHNEQ